MDHDFESIAIIGMSGSFPNSKNLEDFWNNLKNGIDCITHYSEEELLNSGVSSDLLQHPNYVKAKGVLDNIDMFDAEFFGIVGKEAELMDPQHRLFLECAHTALEHAGYNSETYKGLIGIYAGESMSSYAYLNVFPSMNALLSARNLQAAIGNDKDSLTTTVSYHLNLRGPAITVQTSSSTSLVAVSLACQQLLSYHCDMALAGGVSAGPPIRSGYLYEEGGISSSKGQCRAYDHKSDGFVPGSGCGLVVLKRLNDAIQDRDTIWAVIKGVAINNDGSKKVSYSAPSIDAQAEVIIMAQEYAQVDPESISYIEGHGTGTKLGDPVEVAALTKAFRRKSQKNGFCYLGSVKSNIGHLDTAAGIAGLIKTVLCISHKTLVPTLHFEKPNRELKLESSPFIISNKTTEWKTTHGILRAGVTSLGMGGTNTHVVLEEPPKIAIKNTSVETGLFIICLSAKTPTALNQYLHNLLSFVKSSNQSIHDLAYSLNIGRKPMEHRLSFVADSKEDLIQKLEISISHYSQHTSNELKRIVFTYNKANSPNLEWASKLYQVNDIFSDAIDKCLEFLYPDSKERLSLLFQPLNENHYLHIDTMEKALFDFILMYSLTSLLMNWGIHPNEYYGTGIGELVIAVYSSIMSLEIALKFLQKKDELETDDYSFELSTPTIPFISSQTRKWITNDIALSPAYWLSIIKEQPPIPEIDLSIRESQGDIFCEFNPYDFIKLLSAQTPKTPQKTFSSVEAYLLSTLGMLFENKCSINWQNYYQGQTRYRIPSPTYPFERKRFWIKEPNSPLLSNKTGSSSATSSQNRPKLSVPYTPPISEIEKKLANLWQDSLGISPIGLHDNFFDLGGSSLEATILITSISDEFHNRISLKDFYEKPTIKELGTLLEKPQLYDFAKLVDEVSSNS